MALLPAASGAVVSHIGKVVDLQRLAIRGLDQEFHDGGDSAGMFLMETVVPEVAMGVDVGDDGDDVEDVVVLLIDCHSSHLSFVD